MVASGRPAAHPGRVRLDGRAAETSTGSAIARVDIAQIEQGLLNLLKNAHESGSAAQDVALVLRRMPEDWRIDILDRGSGMSEAVLASALLPFYSTKRNGTGLGLALAREITEAHGGHVALHNREGGGLWVSMTLPLDFRAMLFVRSFTRQELDADTGRLRLTGINPGHRALPTSRLSPRQRGFLHRPLPAFYRHLPRPRHESACRRVRPW